MPVVQLQDDTGGNLGTALGAAAGYFATQKQRKADKQAATARQTAADARVAQEAADTHANITDEIKNRDATAQRTAATDTATQLSTGARQKYFPMLDNPPTVDGKPLKGPALQSALVAIRNKAFSEGMTNDKDIADFNTEIARVMQENAPRLSDVEHGMPQLQTGGKHPSTPQQVSQHYLQAAARVMNSDMPDDQKKLIVGQFQKMAADALSGQNAAERERHDRATEANQGRSIDTRVIIAGMPARGGRGGAGSANSDLAPRAEAIENRAMGATDLRSALRIVEQANLPRRDRETVRQDVQDQFRPSAAAKDTSGLSNMGYLEYKRDVDAWGGPNSGQPEPDPMSPKYQKKTAAVGGGGTATPAPVNAPRPTNTPAPVATPPPGPKPVMHNGKAYYLHSDGNYYLTP